MEFLKPADVVEELYERFDAPRFYLRKVVSFPEGENSTREIKAAQAKDF